MTIWEGIATLKAAGFRKITWRLFFVPKEKKFAKLAFESAGYMRRYSISAFYTFALEVPLLTKG